VRQRLDEEAVRAGGLAQTAADAVARYATQFLERWPTSAADLTPTLADRGGFLELLDGIVANGLPEHEARFLDLLRERSRDLIGELVSDILTAPKEIEERVVPVNESLRRSPFDDERFLRLRVKLRRTETVTRFIADLRSITEGSWGSDDLVAAERRFNTLEEIMRRFASSEATMGSMAQAKQAGTASKVFYHTNTRKKPCKTMPLHMPSLAGLSYRFMVSKMGIVHVAKRLSQCRQAPTINGWSEGGTKRPF